MRDRLIELLDKGNETFRNGEGDCGDLLEHLADHLLSEGVIVPPCKVGDTIWYINQNYSIQSAEVTRIDVRSTSKHLIASRYDWKTEETVKLAFMFKHLNESYWLTEEEAEKALERSENGT